MQKSARGERGGKGERQQRGERGGAKQRGPRKAESGYRRLFINLGKADGFYPGEVMQYINKHVEGRQEVGHIDLLSKFSYIEVPEKDAAKVMKALDGTVYKGREVRCNDADGKKTDRRKDEAKKPADKAKKPADKPKKKREAKSGFDGNDTGDWRQFFKANDVKFKGDEPDFSEEGWALRKPRKK